MNSDGIITTDQIGQNDNTIYGADIAPAPPTQDMWAFDPIAGTFPPMERDASVSDFTGGTGGGGIGGSAEPMPPGGVMDGTVYERRGY